MKFKGMTPEQQDAYWQGIEHEQDRILRLLINMDDISFMPDEDANYGVQIDYAVGDALDLIDLIMGQKDGYKYLYETQKKGQK